MKKSELKELYEMMFPDYPDIVTVAQLQRMLGISRHLAYDLIGGGLKGMTAMTQMTQFLYIEKAVTAVIIVTKSRKKGDFYEK